MNKQKAEKIIFHIDVNSAYLSWSAVRELKQGNPVDLRNIPSIVGGDRESRHGIVLAKSIPAKAFGIRTAEPVATAFRKCPDLVMVPPDHRYYHEMSHRLMAYLSDICPDIEQVSVDECYMDFTGMGLKYPDPVKAANQIREGVFRTFGFTVNVGISDKKVLAKMASDFQKPNLVHTLYSWEIQKKMWPLPISELFMCGKSSANRFQTYGIRTIGDLARADMASIELNFKSHGRLLWNYANGIDDSIVETQPAKAKGVGNSTTLAKDITRREDACSVLQTLAQSVSQRLQKNHALAGVICTEIKYASFQSVSHQCAFLEPTSDAGHIYKMACQLFDELWDGSGIRLLGIRTTKLTDENEPVQMTIFDLENNNRLHEQKQLAKQKQQKLLEAMTRLQQKYGKDTIKRGVD